MAVEDAADLKYADEASEIAEDSATEEVSATEEGSADEDLATEVASVIAAALAAVIAAALVEATAAAEVSETEEVADSAIEADSEVAATEASEDEVAHHAAVATTPHRWTKVDRPPSLRKMTSSSHAADSFLFPPSRKGVVSAVC